MARVEIELRQHRASRRDGWPERNGFLGGLHCQLEISGAGFSALLREDVSLNVKQQRIIRLTLQFFFDIAHCAIKIILLHREQSLGSSGERLIGFEFVSFGQVSFGFVVIRNMNVQDTAREVELGRIGLLANTIAQDIDADLKRLVCCR